MKSYSKKVQSILFLVVLLTLNQFSLSASAYDWTDSYQTGPTCLIAQATDSCGGGGGSFFNLTQDIHYFYFKYSLVDYDKALPPPEIEISLSIKQLPVNSTMYIKNQTKYENSTVQIYSLPHQNIPLKGSNDIMRPIYLRSNTSYLESIDYLLLNSKDYIGTTVSYTLTIDFRLAPTENELSIPKSSVDGFTIISFCLVAIILVLSRQKYKKKY